MPPVDQAASESTDSSTSVSTETAPDSTAPAVEQKDSEASTDTPASDTGKAAVKLPASITPPTKTGRFQQRMSDLVSSRKQTEEENRRLREQIAHLSSVSKPGETRPQAPKTAKASGGLNPEDYDSYSDYVQALVDQTMQAREEAKQAKQSEQSYETYRAEKQAEFEGHCAPLAEQYGEGFWDAITDPRLPVSEPMADAVMELGEMAPYVMLWLAANPQKALELAKQSPRAATVGVGRLAARLQAELGQTDGTAQTDISPAPAGQPMGRPGVRPTPVPSVRGSSPANTLDGNPSDKDDIQTWLAKESARIRLKHPKERFYGVPGA